MGQFSMGQPVRRLEDLRLLTGAGCYVDDLRPDGLAHALVLRSPHGHARIGRLDVAAARRAPGVLTVLTAADLRAEGIGVIPVNTEIKSRDGKPQINTPYEALAYDRVRYAGHAVACVVAETREQARDAAELIEVDYQPLDATTDAEIALGAGAPLVWDEVPGNLCFDWEKGDAAAIDRALAASAYLVAQTLVNNRVVINPMEPRGVVAEYDSANQRFTLYNSGQASHAVKRLVSAALAIPADRLRVVVRDVGGGFGTKNFAYAEQVLALAAARRVGRPVKWVADRTEGFQTDAQGRASVMRATLGFDRDGRFTALKAEVVADLGAYLSSNASIIPTNACAYVLGGCYDIKSVYLGVRGAFTNTAPVDAYRGAGRPEAAYMIERLVELAAKRLGIDSFELRRRNFVQPEAMPYKTAVGMVLDCGAFADNLSRALKLADHDGFATRRRAAEAQGKRRGFGIACYFEATLGMPTEGADIRFRSDGMVALLIGTQSNGQGHETSFAQILADRLGLPIDRVEVVQGDTDAIPTGGGHGGSRSLQIGGSAVWRAADLVIAKARKLAAHVLEAAEADVEFDDGACRVVGTDRRIALLDLAVLARDPARVPEGMTPGLDERGDYTREAFTFPNGVHACELEVDPATGRITVAGYAVVDDFGRVINPLLVAGQVHGGIVQGLGQALLERTVYDGDGQLLSGSFMDYCMPRADDLPDIRFEVNEDVPATTNPLGVKGCGEAGCIGALPAAINALCDALGVAHIDMPATPEAVWRVANSVTRA